MTQWKRRMSHEADAAKNFRLFFFSVNSIHCGLIIAERARSVYFLRFRKADHVSNFMFSWKLLTEKFQPTEENGVQCKLMCFLHEARQLNTHKLEDHQKALSFLRSMFKIVYRTNSIRNLHMTDVSFLLRRRNSVISVNEACRYYFFSTKFLFTNFITQASTTNFVSAKSWSASSPKRE